MSSTEITLSAEFSTKAEQDAYLAGLGFVEREIVVKLTRGWNPVQIAATHAVEESFVSQVANKPENARFIQAVGKAQSAENEKFDSALDRAESIALDRITQRLPMQNFRDQVSAFKVLNSAKRRRDTHGNQGIQPVSQVVNLNLPPQLLTRYLRNDRNEIVDVEGRTMVSAHPTQLAEMMQAKLGRSPTEKVEVATQEQIHRAEATLAVAPPRRRIPVEKLDVQDIL